MSEIDSMFRKAAKKVGGITIRSKVYGGAPCVAGTRVPVYAILQAVADGYSHKGILKAFPTIDQRDLQTALTFAALVMER